MNERRFILPAAAAAARVPSLGSDGLFDIAISPQRVTVFVQRRSGESVTLGIKGE
jgi:hypothetical protein